MHIVILGILSAGTCEFSGREGEVVLIKDGDEPVMEVSPKSLLSMLRYRSKLESKNGSASTGKAGAEAQSPQ